MTRYEEIFAQNLQGITPMGGDRVLACCPFHEDDDPSLSVDYNSGLWFCFGCGEKGNAKTFARRLDLGEIRVPPPTMERVRSRVRRLIDGSQYETPSEASISNLYPGSEVWKMERGFSVATVRRWELGFDPMEDCLLIPVRTLNHRPVGIIRRYLNPPPKRPKYKYPPGFPRRSVLFGAQHVSPWRREGYPWCAITEGSLDAIALDEVGIPAIALLGNSMTEEQAQVLRQTGVRAVVLALDNDDAGKAATKTLLRSERLKGIRRYRVDPDRWQGYKDPGEMPPVARELLVQQP